MTGKRFARLAAAVAVCLLVLAAFVVQLLGGRGSVPGWQQLRAALGVPLQTEESAPQTADGSTVVYVLDVGQGDAVLLCQDGAYCLIDTGPVEAEDALLYDLDVLGVPSLDYLVLTHPHADHTGNARAVLRTLPVKTLLLPLWQPTADETADWPRHLAELAADSGAEILTAEAGEEYPLGSGKLQILQGGSEDADSVNDASLGRFPLSRYRRRRGRRRAASGRYLRPDPACHSFQGGASRVLHLQQPDLYAGSPARGRGRQLRAAQRLRPSAPRCPAKLRRGRCRGMAH